MHDTAEPTGLMRPRLRSSVQIAPVDDGAGWLVSVSGAQATLPSIAVGFLLLFDGQRTCEQIARVAARWGFVPPRKGWVAMLAQAMAQAGIAEFLGSEVRAARSNRHACLMCGASCMGTEIGPLSPERVALLEAQHRTLQAHYPSLVGLEVLRRRDGGVYLARPNGRCGFLDADNLCMIHKHLGPDAKPLACRLFPLMVVRTSHDMRLGLTSACVRQHMTYDTAPEVDMVELFARHAEVVRPMTRMYQGEDEEVSARALALLARFEATPATLRALTASAAGQPVDALGDLPRSVSEELIELARRWSAQSARRAPVSTMHPNSRRGQMLVLVREAIERAAPPRHADMAHLPARMQGYLNQRVHNHLLLREGYRNGTPEDALLMTSVGVVAALWYALDAPDAPGGEVAYDRFGTVLSLWGLLSDTKQRAAQVLTATERQAIQARWRAAFRAAASPAR